MTTPASSTASRGDRRGSPRQYLTRPVRAEIVYGRQRMAIESGVIYDLSEEGIGMRAAHWIKLAAGTPVTVAVPRDKEVVTLSGSIAVVRGGLDIGIKVDGRGDNPLLGQFEGAAVSAQAKGKTRLTGALSMSARHPVRWALQAGVRRLDLSGVTTVDSSGIGMLLQLMERDGVTIENCADKVCRLVKMCGIRGLCAPECPAA